jgi:hypothetical protein
MQQKQNGFKIIYQFPRSNNYYQNSFIIQTNSKNKAIEYAKKYTTYNKFKLIKVVDNI